ncbi:hypothetical protein ACXPWS_16090 [Mycobacterium sp. BMJ-28]
MQPDLDHDGEYTTPVDENTESVDEQLDVVESTDNDGIEHVPPRGRYGPQLGAAVAASLMIIIALGGLVGWLGYQAHESRQAQQQRDLFLQAGRQGALNLTTISDIDAEAAMQRILESSTGIFHEQVESKSQEFVALVHQAQTKSMGTIAEAGVESEQDQQAQVLVAVNVTASNVGVSDQQARSWRLRVTVRQVGGGTKVSNVEFVP